MPELPIEPGEFARLLSRPLVGGSRVGRAEPDLVVTEVLLVPGALRLMVTVEGQRWQVDVPAEESDLDPAIDPGSLALIFRANLEEWWAVREQEPEVAAWGQRLS